MNTDTKTIAEESISDDPFEPLTSENEPGNFESLVRTLTAVEDAQTATQLAATAKLCGFNLDDGPLITDLPDLPGEMVLARTTIPLGRDHIGLQVVVLFEQGVPRRPIVIGLLQSASLPSNQRMAPEVVVRSDGQRLVLTAEREIELRCGDASITLTRAGKILIQGKYILSRSSGYNRIKGAAVDIN
jgi:Domain of unknown function (DUF6484)